MNFKSFSHLDALELYHSDLIPNRATVRNLLKPIPTNTDNMSAISELTPAVTVIRLINRDKTEHKVQGNNEESDDKFELIDSNVKDTEDTEDNVIVDPVVYMAWTHPVLKGKKQFIIDSLDLISSKIPNFLLAVIYPQSQFATSVAKPIQPTCVDISSIPINMS